MARIHVTQPHSKDLPEARAAVDDLARELQGRFDAKTRWDDNVLHVERSGAKGTVTVAPGAVEVEMELGMPFSMMKGPIEQRVKQVLRDALR